MTRGTARPTRALLGLLTAAALGLSACATGADPDPVAVTQAEPGSAAAGTAEATTGDGGDPAPTTEDAAATGTAREEAAVTSDAPDVEITIAAVGDLQLSRAIAPRVLEEGTDAPLADVRDLLREADLTIANLESPLAEGGTPETRKAWAFVAPPSFVDVLTDGGIDVVSLANNHILDYGVSAMESTQEILDEAGIVHVGVGQDIDEARAPQTVEVEGMRLGFLSYLEMPVERGGFNTREWEAGPDTPGLAWATPEVIAEDVAALAPEVDHVVVLMHHGWENTSTVNDIQRANVDAAFDAGATVVLGHHPHVLQGAEHREDGRFVAYSLGNFVFDTYSGPTTESVILHLTLGRDGVVDHEVTPVRLVGGFPQVLDPVGGEGLGLITRFEQLPVG